MIIRRVLIVGSNGLLGQKLAELIVRGSSYEVILSSIEEKSVRDFPPSTYHMADITSKKEMKALVSSCSPDVIINAAAMTNVDACETQRELAWKINVEGVENLIEAARKNETKIVHVSSDYVFDGLTGPYAEDARPDPLSYYGKTKLASENALRTSGLRHFIARTMVLYGFAPGVKSNFALWLIDSLSKNRPVRIVDDQFGNPTLVDDLAYGLVRGVELEREGIYNIAGREIMDRYSFALRLAKIFGFDASLLTPIKTSGLNQPAPRPLNSGLITLKAEVELSFKPADVDQGLLILKNQLSRNSKMIGDSAPIPGQSFGRLNKHGNNS